jgi:hypothetical protein
LSTRLVEALDTFIAAASAEEEAPLRSITFSKHVFDRVVFELHIATAKDRSNPASPVQLRVLYRGVRLHRGVA